MPGAGEVLCRQPVHEESGPRHGQGADAADQRGAGKADRIGGGHARVAQPDRGRCIQRQLMPTSNANVGDEADEVEIESAHGVQL